jgi:hypothetical protein
MSWSIEFRTVSRILRVVSTLMPTTPLRPWAILKMSPFTVCLAAVKLRSARCVSYTA